MSDQNPEVGPIEIKKAPAPKKKNVVPTEDVGEAEALPLNEETIIEVAKPVKKAAPKKAKKADEITSTGEETRATVPEGNDLPDATEVATIEAKPVKKAAPKKAKKAEETVVPTTDHDGETGDLSAPAPVAEVPKAKKATASKKATIEGEGTLVDNALASDDANASEPPQATVAPKKKKAVVKAEPTNTDPLAAEASNPEQTTEVAEPETTSKAPPKATKKKAPSKASVVENDAPVGSQQGESDVGIEKPEVELTEQSKPKKKAAPKPKQVKNEEEAASEVNVVDEASACGKEEIRPPSTSEQPAAAAVPTKKTVPPKKKMAPINPEATEVTTTSTTAVAQEETSTLPPSSSVGEAAREEPIPLKDITSTEVKVAPTKSTPPAAVATKKAATPIGSSQGSKGPSSVVSRSSSNTNAAKRNGVTLKSPAAVVIQATSQPTTRSTSSTNKPQQQDRSQSKPKIADKSPGPSPAPNQRRTSSNQPPPAWKTAALASFAVPAPSQGKREKKPQQTKEEKLALHEQRMADIEERERKRRAVVKAQLAKIEENIGDFVLKAREQKENEREKQAQIRKDRMEERRIQRDEEKLRLAAGNLHPLAAMLAATAITAAVNTSIEGAVISDPATVDDRSEPSASPARPVVQLSMADIIPDSQYKPIIAAFENQQASKQRLDRAQKIEAVREREERERVEKELAARKAKMNASRFVPLPKKVQQQQIDSGDSPQDDTANQLPAGSEGRAKADKPQGTSPTAKLFVAPLDPSAASLNNQEVDQPSNVSTPRTEDMNETDRAAIYGAIAVVKKEGAGTDRLTHQVTAQPAEEKIDIAAHPDNEDVVVEEQRKAKKDEAKNARKLAKRNEKRRLKFEAKRAQRLLELEEKRQARRMERRTQKKDDKIQFRRQLRANRKAEAAAAIVDAETAKSTTPTPPPLAFTPRGAERLQEATEQQQQLESQAQQQPSATEYIVSARTAEAVDAITECVSDAVEHVVQLAEPTADGEQPNHSSTGLERGEGNKQPVVSGSRHTTPEHGPSTSVSDGPVSPGTHQRLHAVASETTAAALSQAIFSQEEQRRKSLAAEQPQTSAKSSRSSSAVSSVSSSPSSSNNNSHSRSHSISDASSASSSDFSLSPDDSVRASHKQARANGEILATPTTNTTRADVAPSDIDGSSAPPAFDEEAALRIRINEWKAAEKARRLNVKLKAFGKKHQKEERKRRLENLVAGSPTKQNGVRSDAKEESHFQTLEEIRERYLLEMKANTREFQVQQSNHRRHQMQEYGKQAEESNFAAAEGSQNPELLATSTLAEDGSRRRDHSKVRKQRDILAEALKRHEPMALQAPAMAENVVNKSAPPAEEELAKQKKIVAVGNQYMREAKLKAKAKNGDDPSAGPISAAQQQQLEKDQQVEQQRKQTKALGNNYLRQLKHEREGRGGEGGDNSEPTASRAMFVPRRRLDDSSPSSSPMPADRQQQKQEALEKARKEVLALNRKMLLAPLAPLPHQVASGNSPNALAASAPTGSLLGTNGNSPFPPKRGAAGGPSTVNGRLPPMLGASMPLGNGESKADPIVEAINAKMRLLKMLGSPTRHGGNAETALGPARPNRNLKPLVGK